MRLWLLWIQRDGRYSYEERYLVVAAETAEEARTAAQAAFAPEDIEKDIEIHAGPIEMPSAPGIVCGTPWLVLDY